MDLSQSPSFSPKDSFLLGKFPTAARMGHQSFYDEIELEDMSYDAEKDLFHYPCPCGDRFEITRLQLKDAEDVARCPSCSLIIRVIFDPVSMSKLCNSPQG